MHRRIVMENGKVRFRTLAAGLCVSLVFAVVFFILCAAAGGSQAAMEQRN